MVDVECDERSVVTPPTVAEAAIGPYEYVMVPSGVDAETNIQGVKAPAMDNAAPASTKTSWA